MWMRMDNDPYVSFVTLATTKNYNPPKIVFKTYSSMA
jgi:hypothetical protein